MDQSQAAMLRLLSGYWFSQTLYAFAELRLADHLREGARSAAELAAEVGADADALARLLRGLAGAGLLEELPEGRFANTAISSTLDSERPDSLHPTAVLGGHPLHWAAWGQLLARVRSGQSAPSGAESWFAALAREPELLGSVQRILGNVAPVSSAWLAQLELARFARILDVGGGFGELARAVAHAHREAHVSWLDRPEVVSQAPPSPGLTRIAADFFEAWPDSDAYLLRFVLHDFDADAARLLARAKQALHPRGRLFVIESVLADLPGPAIAKTHDVNMLVLTGGRERTLLEYRALFADAGLTLERHLPPAHGGADVLEVALLPRA